MEFARVLRWFSLTRHSGSSVALGGGGISSVVPAPTEFVFDLVQMPETGEDDLQPGAQPCDGINSFIFRDESRKVLDESPLTNRSSPLCGQGAMLYGHETSIGIPAALCLRLPATIPGICTKYECARPIVYLPLFSCAYCSLVRFSQSPPLRLLIACSSACRFSSIFRSPNWSNISRTFDTSLKTSVGSKGVLRSASRK